MNAIYYSYRYAEEILQHPRYREAWDEITQILETAPLFIFPGKSERNQNLDVVQQVMNTYFDRKFAIDHHWEFHPLATRIVNSGLSADFRKIFSGLAIQVEVQFGNMSRWYSDIFKFQAAYAQNLIQLGLSVLPMRTLAQRIDSNIVNYERTTREIPSATLSITLPILLVGLIPDESTIIVNLRDSQFQRVGDITGRGREENKWRIVNGYIDGVPISEIGPNSPIGVRSMENEGDNDDGG